MQYNKKPWIRKRLGDNDNHSNLISRLRYRYLIREISGGTPPPLAIEMVNGIYGDPRLQGGESNV